MVLCAILGCNNNNDRQKSTYTPDKRYFRFPVNPAIRAQWVKATGRTDPFNVNSARVCSDHFIDSDFNLNPITQQQRLKRGVMPTIQLLSFLKIVEGCSPLVCHYNAQPFSADNSVNSVQLITDEFPITSIDCGTQTEDYIRNIERENDRLKLHNKKLLKQLQLIEKAKLDLEYNVSKIFTPGQIRKLTNSDKRVHFSEEDISASISLHCAGPRLYRLLRKRGFPFPSVSTLRRW